MKKFYLMLAAFVCAFLAIGAPGVSAKAAPDYLYLYGNLPGEYSWDSFNTSSAKYKAAKATGDTYEFKIDATSSSNSFQFRFHDGSIAYSPQNDDNDVTITPGTSNIKTWSNNTKKAFDFAGGKKYVIKVTWDGTNDYNNIVFSFNEDGSTPPIPSYTDMYIRGSFTETWAATDDYKLSTTDGVTYTRTFSSLPAGEFKFGQAGAENWVAYSCGGNTALNMNTPYALTSPGSGNMKIDAINKEVTVKFVFTDKAAGKATATFITEEEVHTYPSLYLRGENNDWGTNYELKSTDGEIYTATFPSLNLGYFQLANEDWSTKFWVNNQAMEPNRDYTLTAAGSNNRMKFASEINAEVQVVVKLNGDGTASIRFVVTSLPVVTSHVLYMHFGAVMDTHRLASTLSNETPYVHFYDSKQTSHDANNMNTGSLPMTKVNDKYGDLWMIDLDNLTQEQKKTIGFQDITKIKDATFFIQTTSGKWLYTCGMADKWDNDHMYDFIYYADNGKAAQSYVTYRQYSQFFDIEKPNIYFIGQGLKRLDDKGGWDAITSDDGLYSVRNEDGVFYVENIIPGNLTESHQSHTPGAKFKMTWIDVRKRFLESGKSGGEIDGQRAWATFNLGIIGFGLRKANDLGMKVGEHYKTETAENVNTEVWIQSGRTLPFDNSNQYDWFVQKSYLSSTNPYTLIVDLHETCQSFTLVPMAPNPKVTPDNRSTATAYIEYGAAALAHAAEHTDHAYAEAANGPALFTDYNTVGATFTIDAPSAQTLTELKYDIEYQIYSNGEPTGQPHQGTASTIRMENIGAFSDAKPGVRAKYTGQVYGMTFHSRLNETEVTATDNLPVPTVEVIGQTFIDGTMDNLDAENPADRYYSLGGYAKLRVTMNGEAAAYKIYADIDAALGEVGATTPIDAEIVHANHPAMNHPAKIPTALADWVPAAGTDGYTDANNWSKKLYETNEWPIAFKDVLTIHRNEDNEDIEEKKAEIHGNVYYLFPVLVDTQSQPVIPDNSQNVARRKAADARADSRYTVTLVRRSAPFTVTLGENDLTGIEDIATDGGAAATDAPVEYYTLAGVRVQGDLTPGIYIRRQGNTATKVAIR